MISFRYVEGGMGSVSLAIANAAREAGAQILVNAEVFNIVPGILFLVGLCRTINVE